MQPQSSPASRSSRLAPIDWMRGLVMVLMTIDHASDAFNAHRVFTDSAFFYHPGTPLPVLPYLTRFITHLCAPTFVFLAGTSLALMAARRTAAGEPARDIDRQMIVRGLFIAALDPLWMSLAFMGWHQVLLQVLYAIGVSMALMAGFRRLPSWALVVIALGLLAGVDAMVSAAVAAPGDGTGAPPPLPIALLLAGGRYRGLVVAYPVASWLAIMMLGFVFGRRLVARRDDNPAGLLAVAGVASLTIFALLRGLNGFGNMGLFRDDGSFIQWIHVAKYPPSLTYCALELGIMALFLSAFFAVARAGAPWWTRPLGVLGSSAMLFYLLHVHLLMVVAHALGVYQALGLKATYAATAACVAALYWPCLYYGRYKAAHANWLTRLV